MVPRSSRSRAPAATIPAWIPPVAADGAGTYFASVNRNKKSVIAGLTSDDGVRYARGLVAGCDVVIENFRPGVMAKFGLDYQTVAKDRPDIVYCSISGFGTGAGADLPGYDLLVQALGGLMSITGFPEGEPSKVGVALVDVLAGQNAIAGILMALRVRDATGTGQQVQVSLLSSLRAALVNQGAAMLATGNSPARLGNAHPSIAPPTRPFARAGVPLPLRSVTTGSLRHWPRRWDSLACLSKPSSSLTNAGWGPARSFPPCLKVHSSPTPLRSGNANCLQRGCPQVNTVGEAFELADSLGLEPSIVVTDPATGRESQQLANPIRLSAAAPTYRQLPPALGEHQGSIFALEFPATSVKGS